MLDPQTGVMTPFATGTHSPVDIQVADDGSFYYLSHAGSVMQISYSNILTPVISAQPQSQLMSVNYPVTFSVTANGPGPLTYQWQRNGVDILNATATTYTIPQVHLLDDGAVFTVRVTNNNGSTLSNGAVISVTTNKPPTATLLTPVAGTTYYGGLTINFSGTATDPETGALPPSAFTWQVDFHHNTHIHPVMPPTSGMTSGSFTCSDSNEVSANVYYIVTLKVTDPVGLTKIIVRNINPQKVTMTFATQPAGLKISIDGTAPRVTPFNITGVVGIIRNISTPTPQLKAGINYNWQAWSDGGAPTHDISTPSVGTTYTAAFSTP
jgi:hypothetical protein